VQSWTRGARRRGSNYRWWHEPSVLITLCGMVAALAFALTCRGDLAVLPALIAPEGWRAELRGGYPQWFFSGTAKARLPDCPPN
jgi:hypothetical protein